MKYTFFSFLVICYFVCNVKSWDTDELEIFDLVEEVNQNFYEYMGINQDATNQQLKRAFRNLSIVLHPDKNPAEDANIKFRNLVAIYDVLKDPSKREKYDKVLKDGLPNWKSALYYYRRVRKMGLAEMAIILFIIITIGQYFTSWAIYLERKYTAEQLFGTRKKRKNKANVDIDAIISEIPLPSIYDTLPFQIPRAIWYFPTTIKSTFLTINELKERELEKRRLEAEEAEKQRLREEEIVKEKEAKKELKEAIRKRKQAKVAPEKTDEELAGYSVLKVKELTDEDMVKPVKSTKIQLTGGFWSDEDLVELVRLVKKYPGGTSNRWEIIGETMNRSVAEVTFMAAKLKENGYRIPGHTDSVAENIIQEMEEIKKTKEKIKKSQQHSVLVPETNWSQEQQRALEAAIIKYKKTGSSDRWQKIANSVPGKTKEECLLRYKYLVELIKSQKQNDSKDVNNEENQNYSASNTENNDESCITETDAEISKQKDADQETFITEHQEMTVEETTKKQGKPRNKRKERKKRQEFSDEDDSSN